VASRLTTLKVEEALAKCKAIRKFTENAKRSTSRMIPKRGKKIEG